MGRSLEVRLSDADRHQVVERLRDAYTEGRISIDELHDRAEVAFHALTRQGVVSITMDLPQAEELEQAAGQPLAASSLVPQGERCALGCLGCRGAHGGHGGPRRLARGGDAPVGSAHRRRAGLAPSLGTGEVGFEPVFPVTEGIPIPT